MMKIFISVTCLLLLSILCQVGVSSSETVFKFEMRLDESDKMCPNNRTKCRETETCCKTKHNSYHCCKYRNAVCCPDHFHCCPHRFTCDTETKRCQKDFSQDIMIPAKPANDPMEWKIDENEKVGETCPNKKTKCKDSQTCCLTKKGNYHCCKYSNAVCCSDKYHCCPEDTTCDLKRKTCTSNGVQQMILLSKSRKLRVPIGSQSLENKPIEFEATCPNNKTKCKDTKTCCITKHGNYYCCPHKNAVCCSDKWACCPESTTCDVKNKKCLNSTILIKSDTLYSSLTQEIEKEKNEVIFKTGLKMATCCSDNENCCPKGMICDEENRQCTSIPGSGELVNSGMFDSEVTERVESEATCPNNKTKCKDTKTCCITKHGNYYCCPHKNAVCCSDKWLCCPEGSTCDVKNKKCLSSNVIKSQPLISSELQPSKKINLALKIFLSFFININNECGSIYCSVGEKCCSMKDGSNGCCKYKEGICCSDFSTCCPSGFECDIQSKTCNAKVENIIPIPKPVSHKTDICPDNKTECFSWETCCSTGNGEFGCCPKKDATCCSDKVSCCPHNTKCDVKNKKCVSNEIPLYTKSFNIRDAVVVRSSLEIFRNEIGLINTCPDKTECQKDRSCCSISESKYGCCIYKSGVCCPDKASCCPYGTKCTIDGCS